jgi:hypothetical protein
MMMAVFGMSTAATGTWWYPFIKSSLEKMVQPCRLAEKSWMLGKG